MNTSYRLGWLNSQLREGHERSLRTH